MNKIQTFLLSLSIVLLGFLLFKSSPSVSAIAPGVRDTFNSAAIATTTPNVGTAGANVVTIGGGSSYWEITNSGSNGVSCFPSATTTGYTYGGGWWLAANGGVISMDGVVIYSGSISCLTGSGTTTLGIVAN